MFYTFEFYESAFDQLNYETIFQLYNLKITIFETNIIFNIYIFSEYLEF